MSRRPPKQKASPPPPSKSSKRKDTTPAAVPATVIPTVRDAVAWFQRAQRPRGSPLPDPHSQSPAVNHGIPTRLPTWLAGQLIVPPRRMTTRKKAPTATRSANGHSEAPTARDATLRITGRAAPELAPAWHQASRGADMSQDASSDWWLPALLCTTPFARAERSGRQNRDGISAWSLLHRSVRPTSPYRSPSLRSLEPRRLVPWETDVSMAPLALLWLMLSGHDCLATDCCATMLLSPPGSAAAGPSRRPYSSDGRHHPSGNQFSQRMGYSEVSPVEEEEEEGGEALLWRIVEAHADHLQRYGDSRDAARGAVIRAALRASLRRSPCAFAVPLLAVVAHVLAQPVLGVGEGPIALVLIRDREQGTLCQTALDPGVGGIPVADTGLVVHITRTATGEALPPMPADRRADIVVATATDFLDLVQLGYYRLNRISMLVCFDMFSALSLNDDMSSGAPTGPAVGNHDANNKIAEAQPHQQQDGGEFPWPSSAPSRGPPGSCRWLALNASAPVAGHHPSGDADAPISHVPPAADGALLRLLRQPGWPADGVRVATTEWQLADIRRGLSGRRRWRRGDSSFGGVARTLSPGDEANDAALSSSLSSCGAGTSESYVDVTCRAFFRPPILAGDADVAGADDTTKFATVHRIFILQRACGLRPRRRGQPPTLRDDDDDDCRGRKRARRCEESIGNFLSSSASGDSWSSDGTDECDIGAAPAGEGPSAQSSTWTMPTPPASASVVAPAAATIVKSSPPSWLWLGNLRFVIDVNDAAEYCDAHAEADAELVQQRLNDEDDQCGQHSHNDYDDTRRDTNCQPDSGFNAPPGMVAATDGARTDGAAARGTTTAAQRRTAVAAQRRWRLEDWLTQLPEAWVDDVFQQCRRLLDERRDRQEEEEASSLPSIQGGAPSASTQRPYYLVEAIEAASCGGFSRGITDDEGDVGLWLRVVPVRRPPDHDAAASTRDAEAAQPVAKDHHRWEEGVDDDEAVKEEINAIQHFLASSMNGRMFDGHMIVAGVTTIPIEDDVVESRVATTSVGRPRVPPVDATRGLLLPPPSLVGMTLLVQGVPLVAAPSPAGGGGPSAAGASSSGGASWRDRLRWSGWAAAARSTLTDMLLECGRAAGVGTSPDAALLVSGFATDDDVRPADGLPIAPGPNGVVAGEGVAAVFIGVPASGTLAAWAECARTLNGRMLAGATVSAKLLLPSGTVSMPPSLPSWSPSAKTVPIPLRQWVTRLDVWPCPPPAGVTADDVPRDAAAAQQIDPDILDLLSE